MSLDKAALGDRVAIEKIVKYGIGDVPTVRELYHTFRPYAPNHPNVNLYRGEGISCCPKCSSDNFQARGFSYTSTSKFQRYQCRECMGWFKSGKSIKRVDMR